MATFHTPPPTHEVTPGSSSRSISTFPPKILQKVTSSPPSQPYAIPGAARWHRPTLELLEDMNKPTLSFPCFRSAKGLGPAHGFGRFTCQGCQVTYSEGKVDSDGDFCSSDCRTCFYLESPGEIVGG